MHGGDVRRHMRAAPAMAGVPDRGRAERGAAKNAGC